MGVGGEALFSSLNKEKNGKTQIVRWRIGGPFRLILCGAALHTPLLLTIDAIRCEGHGLEPLQRDLITASRANTVKSAAEPGERDVYRSEPFLGPFDEGELGCEVGQRTGAVQFVGERMPISLILPGAQPADSFKCECALVFQDSIEFVPARVRFRCSLNFHGRLV